MKERLVLFKRKLVEEIGRLQVEDVVKQMEEKTHSAYRALQAIIDKSSLIIEELNAKKADLDRKEFQSFTLTANQIGDEAELLCEELEQREVMKNGISCNQLKDKIQEICY